MSATLPLYAQLQSKPYPKHQQMDEASLQWLYEQLHPSRIDINNLIEHYQPYPHIAYETVYNTVRPGSIRGTHGLGHSLRVSIYCWLIIQYLRLQDQLSGEQITELTLVALFHDIGRVDDNADTTHGKRSAKWIEENFARKFSVEALSAVADHSIDQPEHMPIMLAVLQSADALDRYRLPKTSWWPDFSRVPLKVNGLDQLCRFLTYSIEKIMLECPDSETAKMEVRSWLKQQGI